MFFLTRFCKSVLPSCYCHIGIASLAEVALPAAEASTSGHQSAANQSSEQPQASSPPQQAAPLASARGSGASPFSQVSAQAAFSDNLDTAMPAQPPSAPSNPHQPGSTHHLPEAHQPFGPSADSPFEHPEEQDEVTAARPAMQSLGAGTSMPQASSHSHSGIDAVDGGHNPSDAQVRNSLTAASQPLPPESTADIDAREVDDRHITISSGSALAEAVQSENASASPESRSPKSIPTGESSTAGALEADAAPGTAGPDADMFSGLHVESKSGAE